MQGPHAGVAAALGQQLRACALDDAARVHDQNFVRVHHGGEAVRNQQRGLVLRSALQLGLDGALVGGIQRAGGLVEDEDGRVLEQRARNGHALLFTARELEPRSPTMVA